MAKRAFAVVLVPACLGLVVYGITLCRTVYFGDSAELSAAAAILGVAHPPGYPLYTILGRVFVLATPGEPAVGVNLLSAFAAALTAGLTAWLAARLGASPPAAMAAGFLALGSRLLWAHAVIAEVYALHAALFIGVLAATAAADTKERITTQGSSARGTGGGVLDPRWLLLAGYLVGLGLTHHLTIVYAALAALLVIVALAITLYATLIVRSRLDPALDWGNPETLARLREHVSARTYQFLMGKLRPADQGRRLIEILSLLARDLHPILFGASLIGLVSLKRNRAWMAAIGLALALLLGHALVYGIPDIGAHLVPAAVLLALLAALGLDALRRLAASRTGAPGKRLVPWLIPALALLPLVDHAPESSRATHRSAREFAENLLRALPQNAVLLAEGDNQVFLLAYLTAARGERPDVTIVDREGNLLGDIYGARGEAGPPLAGDFQELRERRERELIPGWLAETPPRAVFTSGRTNLPGLLGVVERTSGIVMRLRSPGDPDTSLASGVDPWSLVETEAIRRDQVHGDPLTREIAARYWVRRGEGAFERGDRSAMAAAFDSALALAGESPDLTSYLGAFHAQNDMLAPAIPLLEAAVRANPLSVRGWTNLGLALIKAGRRPEGIAALRESLRIQPDQAAIAGIVRQFGAEP
jgi:tetratricopeptide (TPR) repeat protein